MREHAQGPSPKGARVLDGCSDSPGSICLPLVFCLDSGRPLLEDCLGANGGCCEGVQAGAGGYRQVQS